jgi:hypothetical protein
MGSADCLPRTCSIPCVDWSSACDALAG